MCVQEQMKVLTGRATRESAGGAALRRTRTRCGSAGSSLIDMVIVVAFALVIVAMAFPHIDSAVKSAELMAAANSAAWAIQSTRYQAISHGYPYQLAITSSNNKYQVYNDPSWPSGTTFTAVGNAEPLTDQAITMSGSSTYQFSGNGSVSAIVGSMSFTVSLDNMTHTVTVSNYGSVKVQ
jgi:Tfp pilus assembly protein FimT